MDISLKHKKFADAYIKNGNAQDSYLLISPECTNESAMAAGSRLLKNDKVKKYIKEVREKLSNKATEKLIDELANKEYNNLLSALEKRHILAKIARQEIMIEDVVSTKFGIEEIQRRPNAHEIIKAIDQDNKMTGDFAIEKKEVNYTDENGNRKFIVKVRSAI